MRARVTTGVSAVGLAALVAAVALRQPPWIAAPPGLLALAGYAGSREALRARRRTTPEAGSGPASDRAYALAYAIFSLTVVVALFVAFLAVHEAGQQISESAVHAAYWATLGSFWLLPVMVEAWRSRPSRDVWAEPHPDSDRAGESSARSTHVRH